MKSAKRSKVVPASPSDDITIVIPKQKAAGGAAGAVVGGIVGGRVGALLGGVVGAAVAGNSKRVKDAIRSGVDAAKKSAVGQRVKNAATAAGKRVAGAYGRLKSRAGFASPKPEPARKTRKPAAKNSRDTAKASRKR